MACEYDTNDRLLTVQEVSALTRLAVGTLYRLSSERRIPTIHLSPRCIRFRLSDLHRWIQEHAEEASND
jgi:excisionase family DNA binding protein